MTNQHLLLQLQRIEELMNSHVLATKEILTVKEAAQFLDLKPAYLYQLTAKRLIPHLKPGRKLYFDRSELIAWVKQNRQATIDELFNSSI